jgi:hypothetical protein
MVLAGCFGASETTRECGCDAEFEVYYYYYYGTQTEFATCATDDEARFVLNDIADECVEDLEDDGFYGVVCDCWCFDTEDPC